MSNVIRLTPEEIMERRRYQKESGPTPGDIIEKRRNLIAAEWRRRFPNMITIQLTDEQIKRQDAELDAYNLQLAWQHLSREVYEFVRVGRYRDCPLADEDRKSIEDHYQWFLHAKEQGDIGTAATMGMYITLLLPQTPQTMAILERGIQKKGHGPGGVARGKLAAEDAEKWHAPLRPIVLEFMRDHPEFKKAKAARKCQILYEKEMHAHPEWPNLPETNVQLIRFFGEDKFLKVLFQTSAR